MTNQAKPESATRREDVLESALVQQHSLPLAAPDSGPLTLQTSLFGKVTFHPDRALHLHPRSPGVVREVLKTVGDRVRAGEVLARVENNVGVQSFEIVSPIGGTVLDRTIAPGQAIDEQVAAFTVGDTHVVIAELQAQAKELEGLAKGQRVEVQLLNGQVSQDATLAYIAPILDERTRSGKVIAELRNEQGPWRPGQFIMGQIATGSTPVAVRIPRTAVGGVKDDVRLFVKDGDVFKLRTVRLGRRDERFIEVRWGLTTQDLIIAKPAHEVRQSLAAEDEHHDHD